MAKRNNSARYVYGVCRNKDWKDEKPCPKCTSRDVQKREPDEDFVCDTCKQELQKVPAPKSGPNMVLIGGIAAAIIAIVALIFIFVDFSGEKEPVIDEEETENLIEEPVAPVRELIVSDTVTIEKDLCVVNTYKIGDVVERDTIVLGPAEFPRELVRVDTVTIGKEIFAISLYSVGKEIESDTVKIGDVKEDAKPMPKGPTVPFGKYTGPANGLDGTITVTRNYSLDLRNAAHETIELQPGDIITHTKFKNGELVAGYWKRGSQSRTFHR